MADHASVWLKWASSMQRWGLTDVATHVLEGLKPISTIGYQAILFFQPIVEPLFGSENIEALTFALESEENRAEFLHCIDGRQT